MLAVGSGGCTILSLKSLPFVSRVVAVDQSQAQLHLIALKQALMFSAHPLQTKLDFLGASFDHKDSATQRAEVYTSLRPALSPDVAAYWDARPNYIAAGVNRTGIRRIPPLLSCTYSFSRVLVCSTDGLQADSSSYSENLLKLLRPRAFSPCKPQLRCFSQDTRGNSGVLCPYTS